MQSDDFEIELRSPPREGVEGPSGRYTTGPFDLTYVEPGGVVHVFDGPPWDAGSNIVLEVVGGAFRGRRRIKRAWYVTSEIGPVRIRGINR